MHDTHSSFTSGNPGAYPNFVYKQKLVPLPLFNQNRSPKSLIYRSPPKERSPFGFRTQTNGFNSPSTRTDPYARVRTIAGAQSQVLTSPKSPNFKVSNELRTINNYGRLCDQPFVEFSSFHFKQVFGSGNGKRNPSLEPINRKNNKKKISKLGTLEASNLKSPITVHDNASQPQPQPQPQPPKEHKIRNQDKDNHSIIKKVYKIGEYEAIVGFYSLEVLFVPVNGQNQDKISVLLGRDDLKRVYKYPHNHVVNAVAASLVHKDRWTQQPIKKDKSLKCNIYTGEETYPQQKDGLSAVIGGQEYAATIHYPYLDIAIKELDYTEKMMLRPSYLSNLFEEKFDNLQDYIQKFTLPPETYKNKQELHNDELKKLPAIIKKVLKDTDISGLIIFKSLEIHLKNTSDIEPETIMGESKLTPLNQKILRKRKKDVNNVLLRLEISDLEKLTRATGEEITELIKESVMVEEATGFLIKLDEHKTIILNDRKHPKVDEFPDYSEKFNLRFQRFLYEGYIKFPTLELYVPETNYKDVIQLKPSQLQELMNNGFENMQDFLKDFKPPEAQINNEDNQEVEQKVTSDDQVEEVVSKDVSPGEGKKFTFNQYSINIESSS